MDSLVEQIRTVAYGTQNGIFSPFFLIGTLGHSTCSVLHSRGNLFVQKSDIFLHPNTLLVQQVLTALQVTITISWPTLREDFLLGF